jgi:hypothetical protein
MLIFWAFVIGAVLGYMYANYIRPNRKLRKAIQEAKQVCLSAMEEGNKGVYRTIITDHNKSSELTVEVKELAITQADQVKVEYLNAFYKNPDFRTNKGETLLKEVRELLGDYLPRQDIEWYENKQRDEHYKSKINTLDKLHNQHFGA